MKYNMEYIDINNKNIEKNFNLISLLHFNVLANILLPVHINVSQMNYIIMLYY